MFQEKLNEHIAVFDALNDIKSDIFVAEAVVKSACQNAHTVFSCGNGGSAADAQHFAAELTGRYIKDRPSYAGIALTTDTSALTAIANDYGYDHVFARQLEGLGKKGDVLIGISTSGNSQNIIEAFKVAKEKDIKTIALVGRDGGALKDIADISIVVPSNITPRIQEAHIFILHTLCEPLEP